MDRYRVLNQIGDGAFGTVFKAVNRSSGEVAAIKRMKKKYHTWEEWLKLREVKSLRKLSHQNIVKLLEAFRVNDELHLVFEFMDQNLLQVIQNTSIPLTEDRIRNILYQTFAGLAYMHKHGFFHRDLKPENLLVKHDFVKIADFGLAREVRSKPPYTDYVSTRWYRAPEILLRATAYNSPVDMFAMGCIMAEMITNKPLAPGSNENDQIAKFCQVLGTPDSSSWPEGFTLASKLNLKFPEYVRPHISSLVPNASPDFQDLLEQCLHWNPQQRPTAQQAMQHPFFANNLTTPSPHVSMLPSRASREQLSRGNNTLLKQTTSGNFSRGSSHISEKSSRGRIYMQQPSAIQPVAAKSRAINALAEVPEFKGSRLPGMRNPQLAPLQGSLARSPYLGNIANKSEFSGTSMYKNPGRIAAIQPLPVPSFVPKANPALGSLGSNRGPVGGLSNMSNAQMLGQTRMRQPMPARRF